LAAYWDTSALAKLYHRELGSSFVEQFFHSSDEPAFVSRLGVLEMQSVLSSKMRTGQIVLSESELVRQRFRSDVRGRRFRMVALRVRHYELAEKLLTSYGSEHGLRTLDSLHLAVALDLQRNQLIDSLMTADKVLCRVSPLEGMNVIDPEISGVAGIIGPSL
jgi:predicted nucleic acid-binding protein